MASPNTVDIRRFLTECFGDEELNALCFDYFRDVYEEFARGMTKGEKIQLLLERYIRREALPNLLAALHAERTVQYEKWFGAQAPTAEPLPEQPRPTRDPRQIFITHAHEDAKFGHRLAADLQSRGWSVWIVPDSIRPGEKWAEAISRGLQTCGIFVLLLTPAAVRSRWVATETNVAIELEHKGIARFIPLEVERCDVPPLWSTYQFIPFGGNYEAGLDALVAELAEDHRTAPAPISPLKRPWIETVRRRVPPLAWAVLAIGVLLAGVVLWPRIVGMVAPSAPAATIPAASVAQKASPTLAPPVVALVETSTPTTPTAPAALPAQTPTAAPKSFTLGSTVGPPTSIPLAPTSTIAPSQTPQASPISTSTPARPIASARTPTATPTLALGSTRVADKDGMVQVYVPAGEFLMGSTVTDPEARADEKRQHRVYLDAFWIDRTEVTKGQYQQCVDAGKCAAPDCSSTGEGDHPVVCVRWQDAVSYCGWAGRRLPTEAEWEKAARGTDGRKYPWGNDSPDCGKLNYWGKVGGCIGATTAAVGSYLAFAAPSGALDMAGNVWEWVADWYEAGYYADSPAGNPQGPDSGPWRALRGGSWADDLRSVRAAVRSGRVPDDVWAFLGFRCARSS